MTKSNLKIIKLWSTFQTELKYHDHYLSLEMDKLGISTTFIASDKVEPGWKPFLKNTEFETDKIEYWGNSAIHRLKSFTIFNKPYITEIVRFIKLIKNKKPTILHLLGIGYPINQLAILCSFFLPKTIIVANEHGLIELEKKGFKAKVFYFINKLFYQLFAKNRIQLFIVPTLASKNYVIKRYGADENKIKIIPLGFDNSVYFLQPEKRNKEQNKLIIGFAGKVETRKNIPLLFDAIADSENKEHIVCKVVGLTNQYQELNEKLKLRAKELHLNVEFFDLMPSDKLNEFYNNIDVVAYPGTISIGTLEANGCGAAIILNKSIDGLEDRVENGRGILINNQKELTAAIDKYFKLKQSEGINHKSIAEKSLLYSWNNISHQYLDAYNSLKK